MYRIKAPEDDDRDFLLLSTHADCAFPSNGFAKSEVREKEELIGGKLRTVRKKFR